MMGRTGRAALAAAAIAAAGALAGGCAAAPSDGSSSVSLFGGSVTVGAIPATLEEFTAFRDEVATSPAGGAAAFVVAQYLYTQDEALGLACLTVALDRSLLVEGAQGTAGLQPSNPEIQRFRERVGRQPHIASSYFQGASPQSGYALPAPPLTIKLKRGQRTSGGRKVFVYSTGADSPRPIVLKENDRGLWKAYEWSSLTVGVRKPVVATDDDL